MNGNSETAVSWRSYAAVSLLGLVTVTTVAAVTRLWVLTAVPVGFLFGFFLQKGDLCGSSAFSEVILMRESRKIVGLWVLIVVAMVGIGALDLLGWVKLNPKPLTYVNYLIGGVLFGVGMVFAGGCISGCLYKGAAGNLNSLAALLTVPAGVMLVEFGPLSTIHKGLKQYVVSTADGARVSLFALTGLPFWALALIFAGLTVAVAAWRRRGRGDRTPAAGDRASRLERALTGPWKPWVAGVAIGLLMVPAYLSSAASGRNYPLGVTHGVMQVELLLVESGFNHVYTNRPSASPAAEAADRPEPARKKVVWWLVALVLSLMLGSWVSARMSGQAKLRPKPPDELLFAVLGGLLIGVGAAWARGCVVGNIMSGWALMSVGTVLFGVVVVLSNWAATYFYLMGGGKTR